MADNVVARGDGWQRDVAAMVGNVATRGNSRQHVATLANATL